MVQPRESCSDLQPVTLTFCSNGCKHPDPDKDRDAGGFTLYPRYFPENPCPPSSCPTRKKMSMCICVCVLEARIKPKSSCCVSTSGEIHSKSALKKIRFKAILGQVRIIPASTRSPLPVLVAQCGILATEMQQTLCSKGRTKVLAQLSLPMAILIGSGMMEPFLKRTIRFPDILSTSMFAFHCTNSRGKPIGHTTGNNG